MDSGSTNSQEQTKFALVGSTNSQEQPLPKPFKIDDLPQDIQDFINKHGGIGLLVEKCMELNPQWVDSAMAWVFIIQWAREELKSPVIVSLYGNGKPKADA